MPGMCSVPGCKGYKKARSRGVVFHSLPTRDPERCRKWLKAIHNPKFDENTPVNKYGNIRVCSQHFKPDDYEPDIQAELMKTTPRKILKSNVIPSVFSGRQPEDASTSVSTGDRSPAQSSYISTKTNRPPPPSASNRQILLLPNLCMNSVFREGEDNITASSAAAQASTSVVSGTSVDSVLQWGSILTSGPTTSSQASSLGVQGIGVDSASPSLIIPLPSGAPSTSSQSPPPAEHSETVVSVDCLTESFHQETKLSSTTASKSDENTEKDLSQSKTIVNDSCLMELFKKCQTCGQTITKKKVSHCGAQKKVRWSCLGGHRGIWMSSPHLWEAFPEIHLLTALAILFSGGTFTYFKKWAKHLHLNFMGNKTFFEIQKAYLNSGKTQMNRSEQEVICAKGTHQQLEVPPLHFTDQDPLKKIKTKLRGREDGALSSWSSYEKRSSLSMTCSGACMQEPTALSSLGGHVSASGRFEEVEVTIDEDECNSEKNRISDLDSDMENVTETPELRAAGAEDSCEEVYVPRIPQRSTTSELLLECEEEELEPWQKITSQVHLKDEDDVGELTNDQIDCKPEPSPLQGDAVNTSPPKLKTETPEPVVFNNQGFIVASPQLTSNTEFIGSLGTQCPPRNSFTVVPAGHRQLFQKVATAAVTPETCGDACSSEVQQISNSRVSLSSVQCPAVYATSSNQLQSDQSNSQALSVSISLPCFTILELESTDKSNKQ